MNCLKCIYFFIYEVRLCILSTQRKCAENINTCTTCWQQRLCMGTSKCWHTNRCIHISTAAFQQKDCSPKSPPSEKRKEEGCTALSQTGHAPLLQPQRQPALISKSVFLQVLSSPSPHLWEHQPNSCTASWAAATSGV